MIAPHPDLLGIAERAETLCRQIAPIDLADVPMYVTMASQLPTDVFGNCYSILGCTDRSLALWMRDFIPWRGNGPAMVLNDVAIHQDFPGCSLEEAIRPTVVHELAHILERRKPFVDRPLATPERLAYERACYFAGHDDPEEFITQADREAPWLFHEWWYIRIAAHAAHRAERVGYEMPIDAVMDFELYGLSNGATYMDAIGREPERMLAMPFREIRRLPPPPALLELWESDVSAFKQTYCTHLLKAS
jgi:hypothetical protein